MPRELQNRPQRLNLEFFVRSALRPDLDNWRMLRSESASFQRRYCAATLMESFLLLRLGVQVGFFEDRQASRVAVRNFAFLYEAYREASSETLAARSVATSFDQLVSRARRVDDFLETPSLFNVHNANLFAIPFRTFLLLRSEWLSEGLLLPLLSALSLNAGDWERQIGEAAPNFEVISEKMVRLRPVNIVDDASPIFVGFLHMLRYIDTLRQYLSGLVPLLKDQGTGEPEDQVRIYARQIGHIQRWRLDLRSNEVQDRIDFVINRISDAISRETDERASGSNFSVRAKDLLKTWKDWGADFAVGTAA
jgi:hypothetical protein